MDRREFLRQFLLASGGLMLSIGRRGWAARLADGSAGDDKARLVVVFLRGAVDGLNVVVPYGDGRYYEARPTIAIPRAGQDGGVLDLDGHFGLHPALAPLLRRWQDKSLAFVHASGSPDPNRSHFEAQAYMETGTPGVNTASGWMNRLLGALPGAHAPTEGLNLGATMPLIFSGSNTVSSLPLGRNADHAMPLDKPKISDAFATLYQGDSAVATAFRQGQQSRSQLMTDLAQDMDNSYNGAPSVMGFSQDTTRLAEVMTRDPSVRLAFLSVGGWDTHVNQGAAQGQLANHLRELGNGLDALAQGLGKAYADTVILVMSEFGRTFHENGNAGTDHGHGNVMWLMGDKVAGGKMHGTWPGLEEDALYQQRDLAVSTDFRQVAGTLLTRHLGLPATGLKQVFPEGMGATVDLTKLLDV